MMAALAANRLDLPTRMFELAPELRLASRQLIDAVDACREGSAVDCEWLRLRGIDLLDLLTGDPVEADELATELLVIAATGAKRGGNR